MKTIGIIGAGQMGAGIAHVSALAGYDVLLHDISADAITKGMDGIAANMDRQLSKEKISLEDREAGFSRIAAAPDKGALGSADLVIEAATENEAIKKDIFKGLASILKDDAILATNTSSISITRLAAVTDRPEQFIGIHFMNPVPVMQLVEIVRGIATEKSTFEATMEYTRRLGKETTVSEDFPAFIVNRVLIPMINEAIYILYEGVGDVAGIDKAMRLGANHPMGPLQLADFIGLDTCLAIMQVLHDGLADTKYRPCPLLVKYVEAGWLGRKAGKGFYNYSGDEPVPTR